MRLKLRWEVEDERLLWFGSSLALVWSSNDRFIRNMEFIPLKKMDAKGRFNFHKGGPISQLRNEGGGLRNGCENAHPLRNPPLAAKSTLYCKNKNRPLASFLNVINSLFRFLTGHLNFK